MSDKKRAGNFHKRIIKLFIGALLSQLKEAFDISVIEPVKDLLSLDQDLLSSKDGIFSIFGVENVERLRGYYGNLAQDVIQCRTTYAAALLEYTENLLLYFTNQQKKLKEKYIWMRHLRRHRF